MMLLKWTKRNQGTPFNAADRRPQSPDPMLLLMLAWPSS